MSTEINNVLVGEVSVRPGDIRIFTDKTFDEIIAPGFLNAFQNKGYVFKQGDFVSIAYSNGASSDIFVVSISATGVITLVPSDANVVLPTSVNHIMVSTNTEGTIANLTGTAINNGNIQAGTSGVPGSFISLAPTAAKGTLRLTAEDNTGDTDTIISNRAMGQESTIFIPDPGASSADVLLNTGAGNILTDFQQFVGLSDVILTGAGAANWTLTRVAQSNYAYVHTVGADETIIGIDITPYIRTAASKGFRLDSVDVIYFIGAAAIPLVNSVTIDRVAYANNAAVSVTSIAYTGTLPFAAQANPYVANLAITTPAFDNVANSKYVLEYTVSTDTTTIFSYYGLNLHFSQTIG